MSQGLDRKGRQTYVERFTIWIKMHQGARYPIAEHTAYIKDGNFNSHSSGQHASTSVDLYLLILSGTDNTPRLIPRNTQHLCALTG